MVERSRLVLVTGTDTGVGKTYVTEHLTRWLRARGVEAIALKPVETGWDEETSDAARLARASERSTDQTIGWHFSLPAAPKAAAASEGGKLDMDEMAEWIWAKSREVEVCLVEGAGGWLVPFGVDWLFADLARYLRAEVLVVARATLGTLNHSMLTVRAIEPELKATALALSRREGDDPQLAHSNQRELAQRIAAPVLMLPDELDTLGSLFHVELTSTR